MRKILLVSLLVLPLAGCAGMGDLLNPGAKSVLEGGTSITAPVRLSIKQQYTVETAYNTALKAFAQYRALPECSVTSSSICKDPATVNGLRRVHREVVRPAVLKAREAQKNGDVNAINIASSVKDIIFNWGTSIPATRSN